MAVTKVTGNVIADNAITAEKLDITSLNYTNWNTAFSWGDHAAQNYATETFVNSAIENVPTRLQVNTRTAPVDVNVFNSKILLETRTDTIEIGVI